MKITAFTFLILCCLLTTAQNKPLYVGTYTGENSEGIYLYSFNTKTGKLSNKKLVAKTENPSFITFSSNKKHLYSVSENGENSFIKAYAVKKNGMLSFINQATSNGANPCHVQLNKNNTKAVISNYSGGTVSIYNIEKNGGVNEAFQVIDHNIESIKSHAHSAKFFKNNLFVADLGRDFLAQYEENNNNYLLKESINMEPGAGPRHFEISKKRKYIYIINELNSTVSVLKKDNNSFVNIQNISTLSDNFKGESFCADIHLSKNERFLYGSNRGENSIVVFKRDKKNGTIQKIQSINVNGDWPRNFTIDPTGKFLLVANQRSKNISVYRVNKSSGKLSFLHSINTPTPVCLLF